MILANILNNEKLSSQNLGSKIAERHADTGIDEPLTELHDEISPMNVW
jgi:hypothetical protein